MREKYSVELTKAERAALVALLELTLEIAPTPIKIRARSERSALDKLRHAQPVQPSALERLEEWYEVDPNSRYYNIHPVRQGTQKPDHGIWLSDVECPEPLSTMLRASAPTLEAAITAALAAAEGSRG